MARDKYDVCRLPKSEYSDASLESVWASLDYDKSSFYFESGQIFHQVINNVWLFVSHSVNYSHRIGRMFEK